ncbi:sugar phosphate nucleotidyltransferase [Ruminococcus flavefaciens]|uniref:UTP--glucose-1-phosphate uridylyltransferase n=1 Tax=Ruminococcus flavefaciens TaxID=1265 RepID=A0A1M7GBZ5_RUMFL|nr:sugar phosphate nucleotidyltransferase [Ruminococcus flavefaciens]SHM13914.1 UDP-glucose pyrophosphorylase [Ruminococcus flavefaciens]
MKAVIPASGDGTRMAALLKEKPKELAEINGRPLIQYAIDECLRSGIKEIIVIVSVKKTELIRYLEEITSDYEDKNVFIDIVYQNEKNGSGGAIIAARKNIDKDDFCVLFPDVFLHENESNLERMIKVFDKCNAPVILVDEIREDELDRYGITVAEKMTDGYYDIEYMLEKPLKAPKARLYHGIIGRYVLPNSFIDKLGDLKMNSKNEIDLSEALIESGKKTAVLMNGKHYECGSVSSYTESVECLRKVEAL